MQVPVLKQGRFLIATIQSSLTDQSLKQLQDDLSEKVGLFRSQGVIIDVTALDIIDSFATRTLRGIAEVTKLRGAQLVVVGIQPEVAFAMVQMGLTLNEAETALDLEEGLELLQLKLKESQHRVE
jgi:rsbT antagonist protein RsbS